MSNKKDKDGIESLFHFRRIVKAKQLNILLYGLRIAFPFASAKFSIHRMRSYISKPFLICIVTFSLFCIQILPPIHSVKSSIAGTRKE